MGFLNQFIITNVSQKTIHYQNFIPVYTNIKLHTLKISKDIFTENTLL